MVFGLVGSLAGLVKINLSKTRVDNSVFKLHYRWTTSFLFLCCALLAASDIIGKPIQCLNAAKAVTTYCWVASTYTINTTSAKATYYASHGSKVFGLGTHVEGKTEKTLHAYYQWVPFVLFLQGCLFYIPHQIWKTIEGKHASNLLQGITFFSDDENMNKKKKNIIKYLLTSRGMNQKYCFGYIVCECLNLINVVMQMLFLNVFFGGVFLELGAKVLFLAVEDDSSRFDPLIQTFPRVTKCDFTMFGASGSIERKDYLCILPQNILNEKIFLFLWVWFMFLLCVTILQLIYRGMMMMLPPIRVKLLEQRGKMTTSFDLTSLVKTLPMGDFFLLLNVGKNMDALCFRDILNGLISDIASPKLPLPECSESRLSTPECSSTLDVKRPFNNIGFQLDKQNTGRQRTNLAEFNHSLQ